MQQAIEALVAEGSAIGAVNKKDEIPLALFKQNGLSDADIARVKLLLTPKIGNDPVGAN